MSELVAISAYGGPHGGTIVQSAPGERHHWAPRADFENCYVAPGQPAPKLSMFCYSLVYASDGGLAFVPAEDDDLRMIKVNTLTDAVESLKSYSAGGEAPTC